MPLTAVHCVCYRCKAKPVEDDPAVQQTLQRLLLLATERRIEAHIDELIDREDDVLV